jgi:hypothetical protein
VIYAYYIQGDLAGEGEGKDFLISGCMGETM